MDMIGSFENHRNQQVTVSIDELVEPNHFLRTVEQMIGFSFIDQIAYEVPGAALCPGAGLSNSRLPEHEKDHSSSEEKRGIFGESGGLIRLILYKKPLFL